MCTRPDIAFAVNKLSRHLNNPNAACFKALNHLIHYLAGTPDLGLTYAFGDSVDLRLATHTIPDEDSPDISQDDFTLQAYSDASYGGESCDKAKSQTGYLIFLGGGLIDWKSSLQKVIALSSAESESNSAFDTARSIVHFRQLLEELGHFQDGATTIWQDNQACIAQSKNPINPAANRHVLIRYHYLRHLTESQIVRLSYINTLDQLADILTKPTDLATFMRLRPYLVAPTSR
jgi:hypothetical protein